MHYLTIFSFIAVSCGFYKPIKKNNLKKIDLKIKRLVNKLIKEASSLILNTESRTLMKTYSVNFK